MAKITGILCQIITGDVSGAGTDGRVYLGLGGREFCMNCVLGVDTCWLRWEPE